MRGRKWLTAAAIVALGPTLGASAEDERTSYGYVRTLEGSGAIVSADTDGESALQLQHPVLTGDRVSVDPGSRVELVLPDFNLLRLGEATQIELSRLAYSADSEERVTTITLDAGELQIVVTDYALGDELPSIRLPGSTVFLHQPGSYWIGSSEAVAEVVVREGYAEISTDRGSAIVRSSERVLIEGAQWPTVSVLPAGDPGALEQWGDELLLLAEAIEAPEGIDPALSYSASALDGAGDWVEVDGESAWSPHVEESWRPYTRGGWTTTPAGMYWVGYEPWGWVTGHYGSWSLHPHHGWLWYPGHIWRPAWVHWYWGPSWVGWVPFGYYGHYYRPHFGLGFGFYGWAGGHWGHYRHWTFCPTPYLGRGSRHYAPGHDMPRRTGRTAVPRGVITTDTRGVTADNWRDGGYVGEMLASRSRGAGRTRPAADVTPFVARQPQLAPGVVASISRPGSVRNSGRSGTRKPVRLSVGGGAAASSRSDAAPGAASSDDGRRVSQLVVPSDQAWRSGTAGRRLSTVDPSRRQAAPRTGVDSAARVRDAWRSQSGGQRSGTYRTREYRSTTRDWHRLHGQRTTRSGSPARRVIEGVTSDRTPTRSQLRSSGRSTTRPSRPPAAAASRGGAAPRKPSAAPRSSGSNRRPSSSAARQGSRGSNSGGGRAASARPKSSGDGGSGG